MIKRWLFLRKVKLRGGVVSSFLNNKSHCAKWKNIYAGFLSEKDRRTFEGLVADGTLKQTGVYNFVGRAGSASLTTPIYSL